MSRPGTEAHTRHWNVELPVRVLVWDEQQPEQERAYDGGFLGVGGTRVTLAFNPNGTRLLVDGQERTSRAFAVSGVKAE